VNFWKIILATVVIFGAGVMTGGLLVNSVKFTHPANREPDLPMPRSGMLTKSLTQQLDDKLHLTPDQRKAIEKIIADGRQRDRDLWKLASPQFRLVMQDTLQKIREQLTPDQRKQFEELFKQSRAPRRPLSGTNAPPDLPPPAALPAPAGSPPTN
jgi:Spy/CpxP family protein refolding chaperone